MWLEFALVSLVLAGLLQVPGFFLVRALGIRGLWQLLFAPIVSLSLIAVAGQVLALLHVPSSPLVLLVIVILIPALCTLALHRNVDTVSLPSLSWAAVIVSALVGMALGYNLFLSRLDSLDALFQAYDVTQHLNLIRAMADSGTFSSINVSPYLASADQAIAPISTAGFYPAAWHVLCALAVQITGCSVPLVINASMFTICFIAYPLCALSLVAVLLDNSKSMQLCGALTSLAFVAFPWNLLTFGPIYANIAGFALMPSVMALFILLLSDGLSIASRLKMSAVLFLSAIGLALCHPNTIFTCIVFLAPYCISRIFTTCKKANVALVKSLLLCTAFTLICMAFWLVCYKLPVFKDTVSHVWPAYTRVFQVLINVLTLCYNFGFNYETGAQILLGALVLIGIIRALHMNEKRWLTVSYALICFILLVSATRDDELKQILAGFWYTDPMRLAAIAAIAAVPFAALGGNWVFKNTLRLIKAYNVQTSTNQNPIIVGATLGALFLLINFMPEFNFPGLHHEYSEEEMKQYSNIQFRDWPKSVHTTYGDYRRVIEDTYAYTQPLDAGEKYFLNMLDSEAGNSLNNALIINNPMDGSFLAYGTNGLRVYYRNFVGYGGANETKESRIIREHLCEYATNPEVKAAVDAIDARYVLQLRDGITEAGFINLREDYNETLFSGISSITDETPGFTCIYDVGVLKIYQIDR